MAAKPKAKSPIARTLGTRRTLGGTPVASGFGGLAGPPIHVALTGTPGVGKTTVAGAAKKAGWTVVDVKAWAQQEGCVVGFDELDEADVIDVAALSKRIPHGGRVLFEGHLSHLLPVSAAWVIRVDPSVLRTRLAARGYAREKIRENLEAEALDIILQEALDHVPRVIQRDGTRRTPGELFKAFAESGFESAKGHDLEPVDWSARLPIRPSTTRRRGTDSPPASRSTSSRP